MDKMLLISIPIHRDFTMMLLRLQVQYLGMWSTASGGWVHSCFCVDSDTCVVSFFVFSFLLVLEFSSLVDVLFCFICIR